jgi:hypothetical protein
MNKKSKWKKFEDKTHEIVEDFNPSKTVLQNVEIVGKLTKESREIDVAVNPQEYDFIAFECKDYKRPVGSPTIEGFITKLEDVGASKGAIVSNSQYTSGAQNLAKVKNIDLLHIVDSADENIRTYLYANVLYTDISVDAVKFGIETKTMEPFTISDDPKTLKVTDDTKKRVLAIDVFKALWNDKNSPFSKTPGTYEYVVNDPEKKNFVSNEGKLIPLTKLSFFYKVIERYYLTRINIIETKGIYNVEKKSYQTKSLTTDFITPYKIQQGDGEISKEEYEKLKGTITFGLTGVSLYST